MTQTRRRQELWECVHDCPWATNRTDPQWWLSITLDVPLHLGVYACETNHLWILNDKLFYWLLVQSSSAWRRHCALLCYACPEVRNWFLYFGHTGVIFMLICQLLGHHWRQEGGKLIPICFCVLSRYKTYNVLMSCVYQYEWFQRTTTPNIVPTENLFSYFYTPNGSRWSSVELRRSTLAYSIM